MADVVRNVVAALVCLVVLLVAIIVLRPPPPAPPQPPPLDERAVDAHTSIEALNRSFSCPLTPPLAPLRLRWLPSRASAGGSVAPLIELRYGASAPGKRAFGKVHAASRYALHWSVSSAGTGGANDVLCTTCVSICRAALGRKVGTMWPEP